MRLAGRNRSGRKRAHRAVGRSKSGRRPTRAGTTPSRPSHILRGDPSTADPGRRAALSLPAALLTSIIRRLAAHDREPPALAARVLPGQLGAVVLRQSVCRPVAAYRSQPEPELLLVIGGHDVDRPHPADPAAMRHANHATTAARAQQRLRRMVGLIFALASLLPWAVFAVLVARGLFALAAAARSH
jgi:hypothetical protein